VKDGDDSDPKLQPEQCVKDGDDSDPKLKPKQCVKDGDDSDPKLKPKLQPEQCVKDGDDSDDDFDSNMTLAQLLNAALKPSTLVDKKDEDGSDALSDAKLKPEQCVSASEVRVRSHTRKKPSSANKSANSEKRKKPATHLIDVASHKEINRIISEDMKEIEENRCVDETRLSICTEWNSFWNRSVAQGTKRRKKPLTVEETKRRRHGTTGKQLQKDFNGCPKSLCQGDLCSEAYAEQENKGLGMYVSGTRNI
jgi:hypothetical protein